MGEPVMHGRSLQKLGREIAEELDAMRDETVVASARERLFERRVLPVPRRAPVRTIAIGFAFSAALGAALVFGFLRGRPSEAMSFQIGGERGSEGAFVAAPGAAPVTLRFDDGTRFDVEPAARVRVVSSSLSSAELLLESGSLRGDVAGHVKAGAWRVKAGPFDVSVRGTGFEMSWDGDELEVRDITGQVVVTGPYATQGVAVKRGEYLRVSLGHAKLVVSAAVPSPPPPASP